MSKKLISHMTQVRIYNDINNLKMTNDNY